MKHLRPAGVVLSAVALGLAALVLLFLSLSSVVTLLAGVNLPGGSGAAVLSAGAATVFLLFILLLELACAGWAIASLLGLLRMRSWARISTMVIAGCLVGFGLLSAVGMMAAGAMFASGAMPIQPPLTPALVHKACVGIAVVSLLLAALGAGWLVYLAQRRTREAFALAEAQRNAAAQQAYAPGLPYAAPPIVSAWPIPRARPAAQPAPDPLTDFTVARPLPSPESAPAETLPAPPFTPPPAPWTPYPAGPAAPAVPAAQPRSGRPVSITILAIFALIGAFFSLFQIVSPFPLFLFGYTINGWPMHLFGLVWAIVMAIAGLGMLRLQRPAWLLAFGLLGVSVLNFVVLLLPAARARYMSYLVQVQTQASTGMPQPALPQNFLTFTIVMGIGMGLVVTVVIAVLLWRARWAFEPAAQPPTPDEPQTPQTL